MKTEVIAKTSKTQTNQNSHNLATLKNNTISTGRQHRNHILSYKEISKMKKDRSRHAPFVYVRYVTQLSSRFLHRVLEFFSHVSGSWNLELWKASGFWILGLCDVYSTFSDSGGIRDASGSFLDLKLEHPSACVVYWIFSYEASIRVLE